MALEAKEDFSMSNRSYDVTALGELLIDFTENGTSTQGNPVMEANPGGAPCNVLAMLNRLGKKTAFIGKVGKDMFGNQLKAAVEDVGIDTQALVMDEEVHTTLAFVHTYPDGDRDFSFYRNPGADMMLTIDEVPDDLIRDSRIFHFGTLSSTHEGVRKATRHAIDVAIEEMYHIPLVLITMGKDGSRAYYKGRRVECAPFLQEHTIETTGAGDTFCASVLNYVLEHGLEDLSDENLMEMLTFANAGASLITTRKGALRVMPTREEVLEFIAKSGR